jgi:hypothetical protein
LVGNNTVILFAGSSPVAQFDVLDCSVQPTSRIQLMKSDVCEGGRDNDRRLKMYDDGNKTLGALNRWLCQTGIE